MQTTTEQDICALLKGIAISCIRKRDFDSKEIKGMCPQTIEAIGEGKTCSLISWCKILNELGYDIDICIRGFGDNQGKGCLFVKVDPQEF